MNSTRPRTPDASPRYVPPAPQRSRGYALLLTLVMLSLTAVMIGTLAHTSGSEALRARQAQRDLQSRWAGASCRRVLLPALQEQLQSELDQWRADDQSVGALPPASVSLSFEMQGVQILARVDDQQAMPNLNQRIKATANGQPLDVQGALSEYAFNERLVPRPMEEVHARRLGAEPFQSWGQLYPAATPNDLSGISSPRATARGLVFENSGGSVTYAGGLELTLWGDGMVNLWTASPQSLHRVLDEPIGVDQVSKLIELREDYRDLSARQLVQMLNMGPSERAAAQLALTDRSRAYAMWLAVTPMADGQPLPGERPRWSLTVTEGGRGISGDRDRVFCW